jgi:ElaB/YqjD/DUF883 family membrane-anchored ribosome-binding protein
MANENEPDPELIHKQMEETRTALSEKLEALESQVSDTVKTATEAVSEATENVKETVEAVTENVKGTMETVAETFNLRRQMEKRPWLILGGSVALGCALGYMLSGRSYRYRYYEGHPSPPVPPPLPKAPERTESAGLKPADLSAGIQRAPEPPRPRQPSTFSWLGEQLGQLKGLAVSTLMGAIRDLVVRQLPETLSHRVAEEVDRMTRSMGGEPIHGSVLPEQPSGGHEEGRREGNGKGGQEGTGRSAHETGQESHGNMGPRR